MVLEKLLMQDERLPISQSRRRKLLRWRVFEVK